MKRKIIISTALIVLICFAWLVWDALRFPDSRALAKNSALIVYATTKRDAPDAPLVVAEVWKDERKTNTLLIGKVIGRSTVYMPSNQIPDGEIIFFEGQGKKVPPTSIAVRNGRVTVETNGQMVEMTLEEYKRYCGL